MVTRLLSLLLLMVIPSADALDAVQAEILFTTRVDFPTRIAVCGGSVWAYERATGQLVGLSPTSGEIIARRALESLGTFRQISAMACAKEQLIVAYDVSKSPVISRISGDGLPTVELKSRVQDLFCSGNDCYILSENRVHLWRKVVPKSLPCAGDECFYQSLLSLAETESSKPSPPVLVPVSVPALTTLRSIDVSTGANPFAEWGFQNSQAEGRYVAGDSDGRGALVLIDPFRTQIVRRAEGDYGWWGRWGRWGYWEGRLFFPKDAALMKNGFVAVLDGVLRTVALFTDAGKYQGLLTVRGQAPLLLWPSDIAAQEDRIYVADSKANSITAYKVDMPSGGLRVTKSAPTKAVSVSLSRRFGLVPDSDADRCLHCHDGTLSDHAHHFRSSSATHPIEVAVNRKVPLPLDGAMRVTCKTCHDPHHGESFRGDTNTQGKPKPFLRQPVPNLCQNCHIPAERPNSHPMNAKVSCLSCHEVHGRVHGSLVRKTEGLCLECHQPQKIQHRIVETVLETERAKELRFEEGRISCGTCHSAHQGQWGKMLNSKPVISNFCSSCHGDRAEALFKDFHKLIKKKGTPWTP